MLDRSRVPSISSILPRLDVSAGRRGRTQCPIHRGDNHQAFSYNDSKGVWKCFRCGLGGDAIRLVELCLSTDFRGALRWLGLEDGQPPIPDPVKARERVDREREIQQMIERQRYLRKEFRERNKIASYANTLGPDDPIVWDLLRAAYCDGPPLDLIEMELDELLEKIPSDAYRTWKTK